MLRNKIEEIKVLVVFRFRKMMMMNVFRYIVYLWRVEVWYMERKNSLKDKVFGILMMI